MVITLAFGVGLFFRSYLFADANLDEAKRICNQLDRNIIMEQLSFYQS
jgi:ABC-type multidrug transport system fused ATPase/permease subunit